MAKILFLGFISGFPWLLISSMLSLWLKEEGLSRSSIGLFSLVFFVYSINALWSPLIDGIRLPVLARLFGKRCAWIILMQGVIISALLAVWLLPSAKDGLWWVALLMLIIASASATQDIAIDATRIELIRADEPEKVGAGSAMATSGWWLGFAGGKVIALPLVEWLQANGSASAWQTGYLAMALIVAVCVIVLALFVRTADRPADASTTNANVFKRAISTYILPIVSFCERFRVPSQSVSPFSAYRIAIGLLFFIFFFKIGEAFLGRMSVLFYKEVGFSKNEIGLISGGMGTITVCVFAIVGSFINARYGLIKGIFLGGITMAATNLLFAALFFYPEKWLFATAVVADQFTTAISTVAFVAFLSQLCVREYAAAQYAALGSLGNLSRTTLAASSGFLVDYLDGNWPVFFVITVAMVIPSLIILLLLQSHLRGIMAGAKTKIL